MEVTLKLHQVLALVEVDYSRVFSNDAERESDWKTHAKELLEQLDKHDGLNYVPRERTPQGRSFEQATDSRVLVSHLKDLEDVKPNSASTLHFIKVSDEPSDSFTISQQNMELTMKSNGKADLYFHAYFWQTYL